MKKKENTGLVYSTEHGTMCPHCGKPKKQCVCKQEKKKQTEKSDGVVRLGLEKQGRKGKGVTTITGLPLTMGELVDLAKQLKQKCGAGGTVKDGVIEIQGEHRDVLMNELKKQGYTVKRSGG